VARPSSFKNRQQQLSRSARPNTKAAEGILRPLTLFALILIRAFRMILRMEGIGAGRPL